MKAGVVELVDAPDSKSGLGDTRCGFESHLRHYILSLFLYLSNIIFPQNFFPLEVVIW